MLVERRWAAYVSFCTNRAKTISEYAEVGGRDRQGRPRGRCEREEWPRTEEGKPRFDKDSFKKLDPKNLLDELRPA